MPCNVEAQTLRTQTGSYLNNDNIAKKHNRPTSRLKGRQIQGFSSSQKLPFPKIVITKTEAQSGISLLVFTSGKAETFSFPESSALFGRAKTLATAYENDAGNNKLAKKILTFLMKTSISLQWSGRF